jgi:ribosomal protein S8
MTEVELKLVANNKNAVQGIKEVQKESEKLYVNQEKRQRAQVGLIADIEKEMENLTRKRRDAFTIQDIEKYNRKLAEAKLNLQEYEKAGLSANEKVKKSTDSVVTSIGKMAAGFMTAQAAVELFKRIIESTNKSADELRVAIGGVKGGLDVLLKSMASGDWEKFFGRFKKGVEAGKEFARQQDIINNLNLENILFAKKLNIQIEEQRRIFYEDDKVSREKKLEAADKMLELMRQKGDAEIRISELVLNKTLENIVAKNRLTEEEVRIVLENYNAIGVIGRKYLLDRENISKEELAILQKTAVKYGLTFERIKFLILNYDDINEKEREVIQKALAGKLEAENQYFVESKRVYRMQQNMQDANNKEIEDQTKESIEKNKKLADEYYKWIFGKIKEKGDAEKKQKESDWQFETDLAKKIFEANRKAGQAEWDAKEDERKRILEQDKKALDDKKAAIKAIQDAIREFAGVAADILDQQVENAERTRELLDTQISEANDALQMEVELYKAGYASNVAEKQKQVEALKKLRAKAVADEEAAIKKQQRLDTITQTANLITSATEIYKSFSKIPIVGIPLAIAMIATMFASFAAVKSQANSAGKFAKGGWTGEGSGRDETGERVAGTVHEREFVVRKGPAHRFRDVLEAINKDDKRAIFNSFNRLSPDLVGGSTINNVVVQNDGPNQRLDEVNNQLRRLNSKEDISTIGNITVIKKGSTTRIIKR